MRTALAALALLLAAGPALAVRPAERYGARSKAVWLTVANGKTGDSYYLEASQDGKALLREEKDKGVTTRRGAVPAQLVKDFLRETENSDALAARRPAEDKTIFYKGELLRVWAYVSGELVTAEATLPRFGEAFGYAFGEVRKEALKLPESAPAAFLRADPLAGDELEAFNAKASRGGEVAPVETYDIQKVKPLMAAIKDYGRLIPLETADDLKAVQAFVTDFKLLGLRSQFYLPSTRGTFRCSVLEASRPPEKAAAPAAPGKKRKGKK